MTKPSNHDSLADSIIDLVWRILARKDAPVAKVYTGHFANANAGDSNLCDVTLTTGSAPVKGCPKIGTTTFTAGDPILLIRGPGVPLTVIGKFTGDITAAS